MSEQDIISQSGARAPRRRRGPDVFTMVTGIGTLLVAVYILTDGAGWLPAVNPRWALAGGALLVGVLLLLASFRGSRE